MPTHCLKRPCLTQFSVPLLPRPRPQRSAAARDRRLILAHRLPLARVQRVHPHPRPQAPRAWPRRPARLNRQRCFDANGHRASILHRFGFVLSGFPERGPGAPRRVPRGRSPGPGIVSVMRGRSPEQRSGRSCGPTLRITRHYAWDRSGSSPRVLRSIRGQPRISIRTSAPEQGRRRSLPAA